MLAHCGRGQELLLGDESHLFHYEVRQPLLGMHVPATPHVPRQLWINVICAPQPTNRKCVPLA